jgi:hypothetical protein
MPEDDDTRPSEQIEQLRALTARFGTRRAPPETEVQDALERGFGCLMWLEARLQRVRMHARAGATEPTSEPTSEADAAKLVGEIDSLRHALEQLSALKDSGRRSWPAHGFVLPTRC